MGLFTDDNKGAEKNRVELERKAIAESGGMVIGADAQTIKTRKDAEHARIQQQKFSTHMTALQIMLQDEAYYAAWNAARDAIDRAQLRLDEALAELEAKIESIEDRAVRLADGRAVYMRPDGTAVTKEGETISAAVLSELSIPANAATEEEYRAARTRQAELGGYADEIDDARTEVRDPDNPPSKDRLEEIKDQMDKRASDIAADQSRTAEFSSEAQWAPEHRLAELDTSFSSWTP